MKKYILFMLGMILLVSCVSAVVIYDQNDNFPINTTHISRSHASVFWSKGQFSEVKDMINSDDLLEISVLYSMFPKTWKEQNYDYRVENCTLTINYFEQLLNYHFVIYNETVTSEDSDIFDKKYFIRLKEGDGFTADIDCYFTNEDLRILDMPSELIIVSPTWECKACQYYEWTVLQRDIGKAEIIGDNVVSIWEYIKEFVNLNFEFILGLFWLSLIFFAVGGMGLVFVGVYYLFIYLRKLSKEI